MVVIPRKKHRPSFYGTEGEGAMLISPASVDMGGVFITPRPEDFKTIDGEIITKLFNELCLASEEAEGIAEKNLTLHEYRTSTQRRHPLSRRNKYSITRTVPPRRDSHFGGRSSDILRNS